MMADKKHAVRKTEVREEAHPAKAVRKTEVREEAHPAKAVRKTEVREEAHKKLTETVALPEPAPKAKRAKPSEKSPTTAVVAELTEAAPLARRVPKAKAPKKEKQTVNEEGHEADLDLEEENSHEEGPA